MAGELETIVRATFDALGRADADAIMRYAADDIQGIDEISRRWMRGRAEVGDYVKQLASAASDVRSEMRDIHEVTWGDGGILTFWLEQDYTLEGEREHISAPTTCVFRRAGSDWKMVLLKSIPLPVESA